MEDGIARGTKDLIKIVVIFVGIAKRGRLIYAASGFFGVQYVRRARSNRIIASVEGGNDDHGRKLKTLAHKTPYQLALRHE